MLVKHPVLLLAVRVTLGGKNGLNFILLGGKRQPSSFLLPENRTFLMPPSVNGEMTQDKGFPDVDREHLLVYVLTLPLIEGFFFPFVFKISLNCDV